MLENIFYSIQKVCTRKKEERKKKDMREGRIKKEAIKRVCECLFFYNPLTQKNLVYADSVDSFQSPVLMEAAPAPQEAALKDNVEDRNLRTARVGCYKQSLQN